MKQLTLADAEHSVRNKTTRREEFLKSMDAIIPRRLGLKSFVRMTRQEKEGDLFAE